MCAACSPGELHAAPAGERDAVPAGTDDAAPAGTDEAVSTAEPGARFGALRNRDCRTYLGGTLLSMLADNVEQHISEYR